MTVEHDWERTIVARLTAGDPAALAALYDQFASFVFGLARRVTRDHSLAEEITNDVFTFVWERPDRIDLDRGSVRSLLGTVTHRRAVDCIRSAESARRRMIKQAEEARLETPDIAETVDAFLYAEDVRRAVAALPETERTPILLAYFDGYTYRQVAERLGIPEGTAKSRIKRALAGLGAALPQDAGS